MTKDIYFTAATAMEFVFESTTIRYHVFALDLASPLFSICWLTALFPTSIFTF